MTSTRPDVCHRGDFIGLIRESLFLTLIRQSGSRRAKNVTDGNCSRPGKMAPKGDYRGQEQECAEALIGEGNHSSLMLLTVIGGTGSDHYGESCKLRDVRKRGLMRNGHETFRLKHTPFCFAGTQYPRI